MRKCCCCGVKTGAVILGVYNVLVSALILVPLVGYLVGTDIEGLDVLNRGKEEMEKVLQSHLKDHEWTKENEDDIMKALKEHFPTAVLVATVFVGVSLLVSFLLILGVRCKARCLILPWLFLSLLDIVVFVAVGGVVVVALFYLKIVSGLVSLGVYILLTVVIVYSWAVVLAAYRQLNHTGYMYSPAPHHDKPIYTAPPTYYPSAPQHFPMNEYRDLSDRK